ncbi:MAG: YdcF family protein [Clostridia bacterium]|nr:YdcF family protein [Clostridia bacterium]
MKRYKKLIVSVCIAILLCFAALQVLIVFAPLYFNPIKSDAVLILGYALKNGVIPHEWLAARLEKGLDLYTKGYANYLIVSGGRGPTDMVAVAEAMRIWLIEHGVPNDRILVEDKSNTTFENIILSKNIMSGSGIKSVIIVTSDFHLYRAMLIAGDEYESFSGAAANSCGLFDKAAACMREGVAIVKYLIFKR